MCLVLPAIDCHTGRSKRVACLLSQQVTGLLWGADPKRNAKIAGGVVGGVVGFLVVVVTFMAVLAVLTFRTRARKRLLQDYVYNLVMGIRPDDFHPAEIVHADSEVQVISLWQLSRAHLWGSSPSIVFLSPVRVSHDHCNVDSLLVKAVVDCQMNRCSFRRARSPLPEPCMEGLAWVVYA